MRLSKETAGDLAEIRFRGVLAAAFSMRAMEPTPEQWELLRGERPITMRDVGEIGYFTDVEFNVGFQEDAPLPTPPVEEGER